MEVEETEDAVSEPEEEEEEEEEQPGVAKESQQSEAKQEEEDSMDEDPQERVTVAEEDWQTCSEGEDGDDELEGGAAGPPNNDTFRNSSRLLHKDELLAMFKMVHSGKPCREGQITVGMVRATELQQTCY